mmetsp:Transcript_115186/g.215711  ORF Transcript_115186/g.215711 Transcript_115186/m.215711 type:complete len:589 (-) Transcript_115186:109-1875(-)
MARKVLRLEKVRRTSLRQEIAEGVTPELEFCLLRGGEPDKAGKKAKKEKAAGREDIAAMRQAERAAAKARRDKGLSWTAEDKEELLNMEIETLRCHGGFEEEFEVEVRSLCHSRGVTADYLDRAERFNMKQVVVVLGNLGKARAPWAELVHPAMYLHRHEFNILWLDIPSFRSNHARWMKFGPVVLRTLLRSYCLKHVSVLACGLGGAVFLEALAKSPDLFGSTHLVYNMDLPVFKGFNLSIADLEDILRVKELQLWFAYVDNEETYDRFKDGSPQRAYDGVAKLQARLQGERRRGRRQLPYDELLITENLNMDPKRPLIDVREVGLYSLLVFSEPLLVSMAHFLESVPCGRQTDLSGGLVGDYRGAAMAKAMQGEAALPDGDVLPALRRRRLANELGLADRSRIADNNRYRLAIMDTAVKYLALPAPTGLHPALVDMGFKYNNLPRGMGSRGIMASSTGSSSRSSSASGVGSRGGGPRMLKNASSPALLPDVSPIRGSSSKGNEGDYLAGCAADADELFGDLGGNKTRGGVSAGSPGTADSSEFSREESFFRTPKTNSESDVMADYRAQRAALFEFEFSDEEDEEDD